MWEAEGEMHIYKDHVREKKNLILKRFLLKEKEDYLTIITVFLFVFSFFLTVAEQSFSVRS